MAQPSFSVPESAAPTVAESYEASPGCRESEGAGRSAVFPLPVEFGAHWPDNIPGTPGMAYREEGWAGIADWLGSSELKAVRRKVNGVSLLEYDAAQKFVSTLGLVGRSQLREYARSGAKPESIPGVPGRVYKDTGWAGYASWWGASQ